MTKNYSESFLRDVRFFLANRHYFTFCGKAVPIVKYDSAGVDGMRWFYLIDSTGKDVPTRHLRLAARLLHIKRSVNWQIKEWAEGYEYCFTGILGYFVDVKNPPEWAITALRNQVYRRYIERIDDPRRFRFTMVKYLTGHSR